MTPNKTVVLYSGGLDSTVLLYLLAAKGASLKPLLINYGQVNQRELEVADDFCQRLNLEAEYMPGMLGLQRLSVSPSTESQEKIFNFDMILMSFGIGYAVSEGYGYVGHGMQGGRPEFASVMDAAAMLCESSQVRLLRPFVTASKADIVRLGEQLGAPVHLTWSCERNGHVHCGECESCLERREAFELAEVEDLTAYAPQGPSLVTPDNNISGVKQGLVASDGTPLESGEGETPRLVDVEKLSRVEAALVSEGKLAPVEGK